MLDENQRTHRNLLPLEEIGPQNANQEIPVVEFLEVLARLIHARRVKKKGRGQIGGVQPEGLPKVVTFPYSRHSSYEELCHLVSVFKPRDVFPCTVDEERWHEGKTIHYGLVKEAHTLTL